MTLISISKSSIEVAILWIKLLVNLQKIFIDLSFETVNNHLIIKLFTSKLIVFSVKLFSFFKRGEK
jgi:hypothetical protein